MVLQERLYFRNIPFSSWVEHEMLVEEDMAEVQHIAKGCSIFSTKSLSEDSKVRRLPLARASRGVHGDLPSRSGLRSAVQNGHSSG